MGSGRERYRELREVVEGVAAVDAHAHNLVAIGSSFPFLRCFSEAEGDALADAPHTLSFKRSIRDISSLYNCDPSFDDVERHRESSGLDSIISQCFAAANIAAIFIDDGIEFNKMRGLDWHSRFVPAVGRILRIERLAEKILMEEVQNGSKITLDSFTEMFVTKLRPMATEIVAMKSIAAYRSGLEIDTLVDNKAAEEGLLKDLNARTPMRIQNKNIIDYIFTLSLEIAACFNVPMQIHTGKGSDELLDQHDSLESLFGDKDLDLKQSNPLLLRKVLEDKRFSVCRFVLLHASYPFSKEASYLASVYSQVYLDFGLAVPKLSVQGMMSSVKELLELAPINKIMFSSDGYAFPETFYLGAKRAREIIYSVLSTACDDGDLTIHEAIRAAEDILCNNAINFYKCGKIKGSIDPQRSLTVTAAGSKPLSKDIGFVRIIWIDNSGKHRCRVIPAKRFYENVKDKGVGLSQASMGMTSYSDGPAEGSGLTAVGEIRLLPDLTTKCTCPWTEKEEMVLADMQIKLGKAWEYCPRDALKRVTKIIKEEFNLVVNAGFEIEFYLLRRILRNGEEQWIPSDVATYCYTSGYDGASTILQEMVCAIHSVDIPVEQLHAESGKGQFEMDLGHAECTHAADMLIYAQEIIKSVARKHGLLATFVPKFSLDGIGSGSHVHLSLSENGSNVFMASDETETQYGISKVGEKFMAGILYHLSAILAIIAPLPNSYDRIQPNTWSGAYHCWGRENREAPLRAIYSSEGLASNFEFKSFDGCANPHIGLATIVAAGLDGLRRNLSLPKPVDLDPSSYHPEPKRLPKDLEESVEALEKNNILKDFLGEKLMTAILAVRKGEINYYAKNKEAYKQLIHHY